MTNAWLVALAVFWQTAAPAAAPAVDEDPVDSCLRAAESCAQHFPPPPPTGVFRAYSLTFAFGPGALVGPGEQDLAVSHNLIRAGFGLARNLSLYASFEGVRAPSVNPATHRSSWLRHDTASLGVQVHFRPRAYVRGGLGFAWVAESVGDAEFDGGRGVAGVAAVGFDLVQASRTAVSVEATTTAARYPTEWWGTAGLNLALTLY